MTDRENKCSNFFLYWDSFLVNFKLFGTNLIKYDSVFDCFDSKFFTTVSANFFLNFGQHRFATARPNFN